MIFSYFGGNEREFNGKKLLSTRGIHPVQMSVLYAPHSINVSNLHGWYGNAKRN